MNIAVLLERAARLHPDRPALVHGARTLTYRQLSARVARLSAALQRRGVQPGARVAVIQRNGIPLVEALLACFHGGYIAVPMNARSTPHEVRALAEDAEPAAWVFDEVFGEHVEAAAAPGALRIGTVAGLAPLHLDALVDEGAQEPESSLLDAATPAWLFYTSGTTGRMKGATLTHRNLTSMVVAFLADVRDGDAGTRVLHAAPLTHGSGLYALPPIARGATQVITTGTSYDPDEVLDRVAGERVSDIAFLAPTMIKLLMERQIERGADISSLEHCVYGGAPMYVEDLRQALDVFGPVFTQIYGQAEAPVTISRLTRAAHAAALADGSDRLLSAGTAYTGVQIALDTGDGLTAGAGEGQILVRGDVVMSGYWNNEAATKEALAGGWLRTGDVGRMDEHGYLYLLDRNKDVIISGGANVYPREVEEVILEHPRVREIAVVGAPDDHWGERVVAVVAVEGGPPADTAALQAEIEAACRERLSGYKVPRQFDWVESLPKNPYGKVLKREIRATYWADRDRQI